MKRLMIPLLFLAAGPATAAPKTETAVLAGGCFWGVNAVFEHVKGVTNVVSGYAGGSAADATYDKVSSEDTGTPKP
jgi:peptide-methionine (S)-S-oxide reductase